MLVLIRPESIQLEELVDGASAPEGRHRGQGPSCTRSWARSPASPSTSDLGDLVADVPSIRALTMLPETRVAVRVDPVGVRMLKR